MGQYIFNTLSVWACLPVTSWCQIKGPWTVEITSPSQSAQTPFLPCHNKLRIFYPCQCQNKLQIPIVQTIITIQTDLGRVCLTSSFVRWMFLVSKSLGSSCAWRMWENQRIVIFLKGLSYSDTTFEGHDVIHPSFFMHLHCLDIWAVDLSPSNPY